MYFLFRKVGTGNTRHLLQNSFRNYFQVGCLSSRSAYSLSKGSSWTNVEEKVMFNIDVLADGKWPVLHRNSVASCYNFDKRLVFSSLNPSPSHEEPFPHPVQGMKNLSKLMETTFDMNPIFSISSSYEPKTNVNTVELTLNWPETQTFIAGAREKKVALNNTCREALEWLYSNKFINKAIKPIMTNETSALNKLHLNINQTIINEVDNVLQFYSKEIVPALSKFDRTWDLYSYDLQHMHPTLGIPHPSAEDLENWNQTLKPRKHVDRLKLPIDDYRNEILQSIKNNRITLVKGATGCGKTTKVPQYILDEALAEGRGAYCNIAVCLPRRLTAKETARFVAYNRREPVGKTVGYNVRMDKKLPSVLGGSITFMTGQKLARKFTGNSALRGVSHIILDEVHLRDIGTDLVMTLLKRALHEDKDENLKVIIMSATVESDVFQSYFGCFGLLSTIEVPGRTFPVEMHFLDDIPATLLAHSSENSLNHNQVEIDYDLVQRVILWIHRTKPNGGILVFVSGWDDIVELTKLLPEKGLHILPVHRRLRDHSAAYKPAPHGLRKVILATNVAETSITFPDIVYVIDCGIHKISQRKQISRGRWSAEDLTSTWISKANAIQRKGRAGRVCPGECYHLYTKETYEQLEDHESPQILNSCLEPVTMMAKMVNPKIRAADLLGEFPQPPSDKDISETVTTLKELSFLSYYDERPTALGVAAMKISAPLPSARAMIHGAIFRCVDTMLSVLSCEEASPFQVRGSTEERRVKTSKHTSSDHLAKAKLVDTSITTRNMRNFYQYQIKLVNDFVSDANLNEHDSDMLVKSILLNSFGSLLMRFRTPFNCFMVDNSGTSAIITTKSVNYKFDKMAFPFALYLRRQGKDNLIFVDDTTTVSPLTVLLFLPNNLRAEEVDFDKVQVSGWRNNRISLVMSNMNYQRVEDLRRALKDVLEYFVITEILDYPDENYNLMCKFRKDLINCLNNMLSTEETLETEL